MLSNKLATWILTVALTLASTPVSAGVITQVGDFLMDLDGLGDDIDIVQALSFDKFDPALGVLTRVELDLLVLFDKLHDIENLDADPQLFDVNASSTLTVSLSNLAGFELNDADSISDSFLVDGFDFLIADLFTDVIDTLSFSTVADLAVFTGAGESFDVLSHAQGSITVDPAILSAITAFGDFDGFVTLTYKFSDIPEPASLTLLCLGLAGLAIGHRRRQQQT